MDDVCGQLDDTVFQIFQVLEDVYSKQAKLEQIMKEGYLGISRSRYLLGVKWVSVDQILDADLAAKYTTIVDSSVATDGSTLSVKASDPDRLALFELCDVLDNVSIDKRDDTEETVIGGDTDKQQGLRKRHTDNKKSQSSQIIPDTGNTENAEEKVSNNKSGKKHDEVNNIQAIKKGGSFNSLSLFGVLNPQPLRSSQKCFEEAVKISVNIADLKVRLSLLQGRYRQLSKNKESSLEILDKQ